MAYEPIDWKDRILGQVPGAEDSARYYNLVDMEGNVITEGVKLQLLNPIEEYGTPVNAGNLGWMEQGIANKADGDELGNAVNALALGGVEAAQYPIITTGEWLPYIYGATTAGNPTYSGRSAQFTKIGPLVITSLFMACTAVGGMTGALRIGGVPFPINSNVSAVPGLSYGFNTGSSPLVITTGGEQLSIRYNNSTVGGMVDVTAADISSPTSYQIGRLLIMYTTNEI